MAKMGNIDKKAPPKAANISIHPVKSANGYHFYR